MPKATRGISNRGSALIPRRRSLLTNVKGILVQCDASIKAIICKIDGERHDFIVEDLDDETLVIKESKIGELKVRLAEVG